MASDQCYKPCEESCQQKSHHGSFGQKVADLFKGHHNNHSNEGTETQTQSHCETEVLSSQSGLVTAKTQTQSSYSEIQTTSHAPGTTTKCHGRTRREHKRNLLQKIKDGLSGHSSDSSSESDSDNENYQKRKN